MITHSPQQPERSEDSLSKAIRLSIGLHVLALLALFLKELIVPSAPNRKEYLPSLKVDLVALPDQKAAEVTTPIQPTAPEETKLDEAKKTEEPKKIEEKVEPAKEAAKTETADYSLKKKQPKTKAEKAEAAREAAREEARERMKNALARIKALDKIRSGELIKGNKVMTGSSAKGETSQSAETTYFDIVLEKVRSEWELPQWLQGKGLSAKVLIKIDRRGNISSVQFIRSSGNNQFDAAVKRTLNAAMPFPAPPVSVLADVTKDGIILGFPVAD
jgi:TonB family protein